MLIAGSGPDGRSVAPAPTLADAPPLTVGFVGSIGRACFSDLLLQACPGLEVAYRTGSRRELLADVRAARLDIAIYPGDPAPSVHTALLCDDHILVAMHRGHALTRAAAIALADLRRHPVLSPHEGKDGDFRRLVQTLLPGLDWLAETPARDLGARLADAAAVALVCAGRGDALGPAIVTRPIAGRDMTFHVQLSWSGRALVGEGRVLIDAITGYRRPPPPAV